MKNAQHSTPKYTSHKKKPTKSKSLCSLPNNHDLCSFSFLPSVPDFSIEVTIVIFIFSPVSKKSTGITLLPLLCNKFAFFLFKKKTLFLQIVVSISLSPELWFPCRQHTEVLLQRIRLLGKLGSSRLRALPLRWSVVVLVGAVTSEGCRTCARAKVCVGGRRRRATTR